MTTYRTPDNSKLYKQANKRWAYDPYPTKNYTFAKNGCGCCAVLHCIIEREKYKNYTPASIRPYMVRFATKGNGTMWDGITLALKHYGLKNVKESPKDPSTLAPLWAELRKGNRGGVLLLTNKKGPDGTVWTMGGHYIAYVGYKEVNGKHYFYIKDSGSRHGKGWICFERKMRGCVRKYWVGEYPNEIELPSKGYWAKGDKSPEIVKIQKFLKAKGFYKGVCKGGFRKLTDEAVRSWQAKSGLVEDGKWGPKCNAEYEAQK